MMRASILFITYQHEKFVAEAIRSAMAQDHLDIELIICDDGSSDKTREILEAELINCPSHIPVVRLYADKNQGLHENFNKGLAVCTGDIVVAMSGDDISLPHRVSSICKEFESDPNCMLVFSNWTCIDDLGNKHKIGCNINMDKVFSYFICKTNIYAKSPVCGATAAYRITLRDQFPPMIKGRHGEDNCFWLRALLVGSVKYLSEPLVLWRSHQASLSNWSKRLATDDLQRYIRFLKSHELFWRQWNRDLSHAVDCNIISESEKINISHLIAFDRELRRLERYSLTNINWGLWYASVVRFMRLNFGIISFIKILFMIRRKHLRLRLFNKYKIYYLQKR